MAASDATAAKGTTLTWDGDIVGELNSIGDIDLTTDEIDVTHYSSDDGYKESIPGMKDGGELSLEGNFDPNDVGQAGLLTDFTSGDKKAFIITLPNTDASTWTGTAYVKSFGTTMPMGDKLGFKAVLRISGKPTFTV